MKRTVALVTACLAVIALCVVVVLILLKAPDAQACSDWRMQVQGMENGAVSSDSQLQKLVIKDASEATTAHMRDAFTSLAEAISREDDNSIAAYTLQLDHSCGV